MRFDDDRESFSDQRPLSSHPSSKGSLISGLLVYSLLYLTILFLLFLPLMVCYQIGFLQSYQHYGVLFALVTVPAWSWFSWHYYKRIAPSFSTSLYLYSEGLLFVRGHQEREIDYEDIATFTFDIADIYVNGVLHEKTLIDIELIDGEVIHLASNLVDMRKCASRLKELTFRHFLRRMRKPFEAGKTIDFGPDIQIRQRDFIAGGETYSWKDVYKCDIDNGEIILQFEDEVLRFPASRAKNVHVLLHVIENLSGQRSSQKKDRSEDENEAQDIDQEILEWIRNEKPRAVYSSSRWFSIQNLLVGLLFYVLAWYLLFVPPNFFDHPNTEDNYLFSLLVGITAVGAGMYAILFSFLGLGGKTMFYKDGFVTKFAGLTRGCRWEDIISVSEQNPESLNPLVQWMGHNRVLTITPRDDEPIRLNQYLLTESLSEAIRNRNLPRLYRWRS